MKKYEYMVVYSFKNGMGRIKITTTKFVESYNDVENLDKTIREYNGIDDAIVINFKLLRVIRGE